MLRVSVAIALPNRQEVIEVRLQPGATVGDAVREARIAERFPDVDLPAAQWAIWSRPASPATVLKEHDRVELLRPLRADVKERRRARARLSPSPRRSRSGT